ncbi:MAG: TetR/AcrR family transcriptional regulator [Actinomycetota bacterium]
MGRTATPATPAKQRTPLTRERITQAALHIMDTEGLEAVSMRRVAREVGVEAMSLYHHVRDKDDLLNGVVEQVMREFPFPQEPVGDDWLEAGREIARGWRDLLRTHPSAIQLFAERKSPSASEESLRPMDVALTALRNAGLSDRDAVQAFHTIGGYIFGYVMMETGRLFGDPAAAHDFPDVSPEQLPSVAACAPFLANCDFDEQFEFGLDLMIEGLRAKVGAN